MKQEIDHSYSCISFCIYFIYLKFSTVPTSVCYITMFGQDICIVNNSCLVAEKLNVCIVVSS